MKRFASQPVTASIAIYAGMIASALLFWRQPLLLALLYSLLSTFLLARSRSRQEWWIFGVALILGPAAELAAIQAGAWRYALAPWLIPVWLPLAWGLTALVFLRLARTLGSE